jgi:hypothetical protein
MEKWEFLNLLISKLPAYKTLILEHVQLEMDSLLPSCAKGFMTGFNMLYLINERKLIG